MSGPGAVEYDIDSLASSFHRQDLLHFFSVYVVPYFVCSLDADSLCKIPGDGVESLCLGSTGARHYCWLTHVGVVTYLRMERYISQ